MPCRKDYKRHPRFKDVTSWEVVELHPGDVLFIPAFWRLGEENIAMKIISSLYRALIHMYPPVIKGNNGKELISG